MKTTGHVIITRVQFCETCFKNKQPQKGTLFATVGKKSQQYKVRVATRNVPLGFTPHIIQIHETEKGSVIYSSYCAIDGCGCDLEWQENTDKYKVQPTRWQFKTVTTKEWNSLVLYKDDEDYFLD